MEKERKKERKKGGKKEISLPSRLDHLHLPYSMRVCVCVFKILAIKAGRNTVKSCIYIYNIISYSRERGRDHIDIYLHPVESFGIGYDCKKPQGFSLPLSPISYLKI